MDYLKFIVSNKKDESIHIQRVKVIVDSKFEKLNLV